MPSIFISSTFKDLQDERNFFSYKISAEINKFTLKNYGENYYFRDLRLGVENIEEDFQTINACLYYLKNDAPPNPYVAIIGDNLGWVPKKETIEDAINNLSDEDGDLKKVLNDVLEESSGKSITNIEIDYAAFGKGDPENSEKYKKRTLFIFKSKEEHGDPSLKRLKDDIKKEFPDSIIYMDDYENPLENKKFKNAVLKKMKTIIKKANNGKLSGVVKERKIHENYMELKAKGFYGRTDLIETIKSSVNGGNVYTYIYGDSGIGKSSLISKIAKDYKEEIAKDYKEDSFVVERVFPIYCGLTPDSDSAFNLITAITNYLKQFLSDEQKETVTKASESNDVLEIYKSVCYLYNEDSETKSVLIVIDAIDQLKPDKFKDECAFLSYNGHKKIHFLFSGTEDGKSIEKKYNRFRLLDENQNFNLLKITGIDETEKETLLKSIFKNELDKGQLLNAVVKKIAVYKISSPLYLKLIALRIANLTPTEMKELGSTGGHRSEKYVEIVDRFLNSIEETENEGDKQLENLVKAFFKSICEGKNDLYSVLQYIALSRHGLPESVIKAIDKGFDMSQFELLQYSLRGVFFEHNDGCIDFTHKIFRNTLRKQIENEKEYHEAIFEVLEVLKYEKTYIDFVKTEYAYHAFFAGKEQQLNRYIFDNKFNKKDSEYDRKDKEERLDYVAKILVEIPVSELFRPNGKLIDYKSFVSFCFDRFVNENILQLKTIEHCNEIYERINIHYYEKIIRRSVDVFDFKRGKIKDTEKLTVFLNNCLYYCQNVKKSQDFIMARENHGVLKDHYSYKFCALWYEKICGVFLKNPDLLASKKLPTKIQTLFSKVFSIVDQTKEMGIKMQEKDWLFYDFAEDNFYVEESSDKEKFDISTYKNLKNSVAIEKCSAEELVVYYSKFMDDIFKCVEPHNLCVEYDFVLNFLVDYIDYYDYHAAAISAIKKCLESILNNQEHGKFKSEYICQKYIDVIEFFMNHYKKPDICFNKIENVEFLFRGIPDCFENVVEESGLKRKWSEFLCEFIKISHVDFCHFSDPSRLIPKLVESLNLFEKNVNLFKQEGYEDLVKDTLECTRMIIDNFFCYYEKHSFCKGGTLNRTLKSMILSSLNNGGVGNYLNIETIYESLSEKEHILNSFNSLLAYTEEYEKNRNKESTESVSLKKRGRWNWKRPVPES